MLVDGNESKYIYDNLYQLVSADYPAAWGVADVNYYYDALGSRTSTYNGSTTTYNRNNLNQYTSVGGISYSYDDNGNLTDDGTHLYYYDCENRLTDVNNKSTGNPIASYKYDYQGRRVSKTQYAPLTTQHYVYDGDQVIAEYDGSGTLLRKFIYGPSIDEPICMIDVTEANKVYYYHFDGLGSVIALSDVNSVIVERYSYDVFGEPNRTSSVGNPYLFTARAFDTETGNYYYRARYYKPEIGRFLQTDPLGYAAGLNLYTYCRNNPVTWSDPYGLRAEPGVIGEYMPLLLPARVKLALATPILGPVNTPAYNCHSYAWHDSQGDPTDPRNRNAPARWDNSPSDDLSGYVKISPYASSKVGDRILYGFDLNGNGILELQEYGIQHSAIVSEVNEEGLITRVTSKWGQALLYEHHPYDLPSIAPQYYGFSIYGYPVEFYRPQETCKGSSRGSCNR